MNLLPVFMAPFSITDFLNGAIEFAQKIGGYVVILAGIILLIVGIVQIAKGLAGGGKGQVNWVYSIGCLIVGGALMFGGWKLVAQMAAAGGGALSEMAKAGEAATPNADGIGKRDVRTDSMTFNS